MLAKSLKLLGSSFLFLVNRSFLKTLVFVKKLYITESVSKVLKDSVKITPSNSKM